MKDLKHLLYFENLLQEAHNDLIAQAQNEGKICVAYACENTPEPLPPYLRSPEKVPVLHAV